MAAAFREVGFKTNDIHMTDLISKKYSLNNLKGGCMWRIFIW